MLTTIRHPRGRSLRTSVHLALAAIAALFLAAGHAAPARAQSTELITLGIDGRKGNAFSWLQTMSADGRYVAFASEASNLVSDDTNGDCDVFVHDRQTRTTELITKRISESGRLLSCFFPRISADGRFVAYSSSSNNLVPNDTNFVMDVFLYDRQMETTKRISVAEDGTQGNWDSIAYSISADGRFVAMVTGASNLVPNDTDGKYDVLVYDGQTETLVLASVNNAGVKANGSSNFGAISADGRYVLFASDADNLVPGDTLQSRDFFIHDRVAGTTEWVSVTATGEFGGAPENDIPAISADGNLIAFASRQALVPYIDPFPFDDFDDTAWFDIYLRDRQTDSFERISVDGDGIPRDGDSEFPVITPDDRFVAFQSFGSYAPYDFNDLLDIYVRDRLTGTTERASVNSGGRESTRVFSPSGFPEDTSNGFPAISADGRIVAFSSNSPVFAPDIEGNVDSFNIPDRQVYVRDRGSFENNAAPTVSTDGPYVVDEGGSVALSATGDDPDGDFLTYDWDLNDNGGFETAGQTVTFSAAATDGPATATIYARAMDPSGVTAIASTTVTVNNVAPTADAGGPYTLDEGASVTVSATGSDPGGDALSYVWDLDNDGTFETSGQTAVFSAAAIDGPTTRTIAVQATDSSGETATDSATVTIDNVAPTADAGGPYTVPEGGSVTVTATGADPAPADVLAYAWDLDNDGTFETAGQTASFSAAGITAPATHTINVRVLDDDGGTAVAGATVTIIDGTPTVSAGGPYGVTEGGSVSLAASGTDPLGGALTYAWDLDNDGSFETLGQSVVFSAAAIDGPATRTIAVQATNSLGNTATDSATVTVTNAAPTAKRRRAIQRGRGQLGDGHGDRQ